MPCASCASSRALSVLHRLIILIYPLRKFLYGISTAILRSDLTQEERDLIVKLVVACCSCEFHITAIFDDLDRRFAHRPFALAWKRRRTNNG